jgi:hypothetical protein
MSFSRGLASGAGDGELVRSMTALDLGSDVTYWGPEISFEEIMWGTIGTGRIDTPGRRKRGSFNRNRRERLKLVPRPLFTFTTAISSGSVRGQYQTS